MSTYICIDFDLNSLKTSKTPVLVFNELMRLWDLQREKLTYAFTADSTMLAISLGRKIQHDSLSSYVDRLSTSEDCTSLVIISNRVHDMTAIQMNRLISVFEKVSFPVAFIFYGQAEIPGPLQEAIYARAYNIHILTKSATKAIAINAIQDVVIHLSKPGLPATEGAIMVKKEPAMSLAVVCDIPNSGDSGPSKLLDALKTEFHSSFFFTERAYLFPHKHSNVEDLSQTLAKVKTYGAFDRILVLTLDPFPLKGFDFEAIGIPVAVSCLGLAFVPAYLEGPVCRAGGSVFAVPQDTKSDAIVKRVIDHVKENSPLEVKKTADPDKTKPPILIFIDIHLKRPVKPPNATVQSVRDFLKELRQEEFRGVVDVVFTETSHVLLDALGSAGMANGRTLSKELSVIDPDYKHVVIITDALRTCTHDGAEILRRIPISVTLISYCLPKGAISDVVSTIFSSNTSSSPYGWPLKDGPFYIPKGSPAIKRVKTMKDIITPLKRRYVDNKLMSNKKLCSPLGYCS
jgi:hypothetical protein